MNKQTIKRFSFVLFAALLLALAGTAAPALAEAKSVPVSHFITPYEGELVSGMVYVEVFMHTGVGQEVEFGVDGSAWQKMDYIGNGRYANKWDANYVEVGQHTLIARFAQNSSGTISFPAHVTVIVYNPMPPRPTEIDARGQPVLFGSGSEPAAGDAGDDINILILALGETQTIGADPTTIQFARVLEDTRPLENSSSVEPGFVEIQLLVWTYDRPTPASYTLRLDPLNPGLATVTLENRTTVTLRWVSPPPGSDPAHEDTYTIGLQFTFN